MNAPFELFPKQAPGTYPIYSEHGPSDEFVRAICDGGTPVNDCDLCGRVHFNSTGEYMDEGELEDLIAKQKKEPEKYYGQNGQIYHGEIDGKAVVYGCPCNGLYLYERLIWNERHMISRYIVAQTASNERMAKLDSKSAAELQDAVKKSGR